MITIAQYFGAKPHTAEEEAFATDLLTRVNALRDEAEAAGIKRLIDPDTGTEISGSRGGAGDGGFRLPTATTGRGKSSHKEAKGGDVFDPADKLDAWITTYDRSGGIDNTLLEKHGLYREHPDSTEGWCHLTTRAPGSKRRTFYP